MLRKNTKWMVVVFVALAGYALYLQNTPGETEPTPTLPPPPEYLFDLNPLDLLGITIIDAEGEQVSFLVDDEENWYIIEPEEYPTDRLDVQRFFQGVSSLMAWVSLTDVSDITALNTIGLSEPGYQIIVYSKDAPDIEIRIGSETVTGNGYYVLVDEGFPQVVQKSYVDSLIGLHSELPLLPEPTATFDLTIQPGDLEMTQTAEAELELGGTPAEETPEATPESTPEPTEEN